MLNIVDKQRKNRRICNNTERGQKTLTHTIMYHIKTGQLNIFTWSQIEHDFPRHRMKNVDWW